MKDTKINCFSEICYWNIGKEYKDNCARSEICISEDGRCQHFVTKEVAERRLKIAAAEFRKKGRREEMNNEERVKADIQKVWKAGILERVRKMNDKEAEDIVVCIIDILTARKHTDWLVVHIIKQALSGKAELFSALVLRTIADWLETADSK